MIWPLISPNSLNKTKVFAIPPENLRKTISHICLYFCNPLAKTYFSMIWPGCLLVIL